MNVMLLVSGADVSGAAVQSLLLARALLRRGHEITLVCDPGAWVARQLAGEAAYIVESPMSCLPLAELHRVADIARERRVDVANTHTARAHAFGACLRRLHGVPYIATAHSHEMHAHWLMADRVIANSDATRRYLLMHNRVPARKVVTVHRFVDATRLGDLAIGASSAARSDLGLPPDAPVLGVIGDVIRRKGQIHVVRALPEIIDAFPATRLLLVGAERSTDGYQLVVEDEARRLGVAEAIVWMGYRPDLSRVLSALDVCIVASLDEVLPLVLIEAMGAARAVVATNVGAVRECVVADRTGLLVRPSDHAGIAQATLALLNSPPARQRLGENARRMVCERFSVESQVPLVERVLSDVAAGARQWRQRRARI